MARSLNYGGLGAFYFKHLWWAPSALTQGLPPTRSVLEGEPEVPAPYVEFVRKYRADLRDAYARELDRRRHRSTEPEGEVEPPRLPAKK